MRTDDFFHAESVIWPLLRDFAGLTAFAQSVSNGIFSQCKPGKIMRAFCAAIEKRLGLGLHALTLNTGTF